METDNKDGTIDRGIVQKAPLKGPESPVFFDQENYAAVAEALKDLVEWIETPDKMAYTQIEDIPLEDAKQALEQCKHFKKEKEHPSYVGLIYGIGGPNAAFFVWDAEMQGYDICNTGFNNTSLGKGTLNGAIQEAQYWAETEGVEYKGPEIQPQFPSDPD